MGKAVGYKETLKGFRYYEAVGLWWKYVYFARGKEAKRKTLQARKEYTRTLRELDKDGSAV